MVRRPFETGGGVSFSSEDVCANAYSITPMKSL